MLQMKSPWTHNGIRDAVNDFLARCNFSLPVTQYDRDFHNSCCDVARGKGYPVDSPSLQPFIPGGVVMATTTYAHLQNKSTKILIALYTAFLIYIDDVYQHDVEGIGCFNERFISCQAQDDPVLDALGSLLREFHQHFGRAASNIMITSTLNFMTSLLLDHETQGMPVSPKALDYPYFSRVMCGTSEAYSLFAFPPEIPMKFYIQALPEIMKFFNNGNDILSFYKEELAGESINHISNMAKCHGVSKIEILRRLSEEVATCHSKSLEILSPYQEALAAYTKFSQGFIVFHASLARYRLSELFSHNA